MDETRARFLTAIAAQLGAERIVEVHLFSPIRQGVLETGVAVVAVEPTAAVAETAATAGAALVDAEVAGSPVTEEVVEAESADEVVDEMADEVVDETADEVVDGADAVSASSDEGEDESPYAADPDAAGEVAVAIAEDDAVAAETQPVAASAAVAIERHVIYTARYRLTRKGPDRGKWLFELAATADAPLATADVVARGVTMRAKDVTETERLSGEQLRALLQEPAWRTTP